MSELNREIAANFMSELNNLLDKFDGMILNVTLIGCLDVVKTQLIANSLVRVTVVEDDDEDGGGA